MEYSETVYNGLEAIKITIGISSCIITKFGAHCVSWKHDGEELLYMSSIAKFDGSVHGVVVHISREASSSTSGIRTVIAGSCTSR